MELYARIQQWIDSILVDKLESVTREIKELEDSKLDLKLNKLVFRALLCLSHTAERTKPSEVQTGKEIFQITDSLCYSLKEIPDFIKYFSSLYHIARKLIAMELYSEAMKVTEWSFPNNLVYGLTPQQYDMYPKIASLWREAATRLSHAIRHNYTQTDHELLLDFMVNEFKVLEIIAKENAKLVLCKIIRYLMELDALFVELKRKSHQSHYETAKNFLTKLDMCLTIEEKYDVYREVLRFINSGIVASINASLIENALVIFVERCSAMETIFNRDLELCNCLLIYKNMGIMLLKPTEKSKKLSHLKLQDLRKKVMKINQTFPSSKGILWNMRMIGFILQPLFVHWENCVNNCDPGFLNTAVLQDILDLLKLMFFVLNSIWTSNCEVCHGNSCRMEKNIHTITVVSVRCLIVLSKIPAGDLLKDIFPLMQQVLEESVAAIFEMKNSGCAQWSSLWNNCGINIYNLSVSCHKTFYEESAFLFSLLCSCIIKFEGINSSNSMFPVKNPLSYVLHRLSSIHFNHGSYREAMTPCALNGLLSYQDPDSKAFHMWANIKHSCTNSRDILKMTMLSCLRKDMDVISDIGIQVNLNDYDLIKLCLRELRGLQEARCNLSLAMQSVLSKLQILKSRSLEYTWGVMLLGYHLLLYQYDENFLKHLEQARRKLMEDKDKSNFHIFADAHLDFYTFVVNLHKIVNKTKVEMETAKFSLRASKSILNEGQLRNNDTVVPAYTKINVSEDSKLFSSLQQALSKWTLCIERNISFDEKWYLLLTLRTLVIVAEYSRLHQFSTLETKAWLLVYKLAYELKDTHISVYAVGRSISLQNINNEWIKVSSGLIPELTASCDPEKKNAVAFFWLNLSNLYFRIGKHSEGAELLQKVLALPNISPLKNVPLYLLSIDTILGNHNFCSNDNRSTKYMVYIVRCLYSLLALMEYAPRWKTEGKERQLYTLETFFTCTTHLSLRMNSMLSFREISSHLISRLKLAQSMGVTLRVAECLKNLCFIDLSRMQLDDCVVKLQGLEYILQTEHIEESRSAKNTNTLTIDLDEYGCRDSHVNSASPILRKTVFKRPEYFTHVECSCYKCNNDYYQYLVFSSTHIRAKLYFLQGYINEAIKHFDGAFLLQQKLLKEYSQQDINRQKIPENDKVKHPWKSYHNAVEYALLLIDFSRLVRELASGDNQDAMNIAVEAVNVCEKFHLQSHPVYISAKELVLEYQFCNLYPCDAVFNKFTVPDPTEIDINKFLYEEVNTDPSAITTPVPRPCIRKPKTMRRVKTPPLLKLTKISIDLNEDEQEPESPKSSRQRPKVSHRYATETSVRRKNLEKYLDSSSDSSDSNEAKTGAASIPADTVENRDQETIKKIIGMGIKLFPNLSKSFTEIVDKAELTTSEIIAQITKLVEQQTENSKSKIESMEFGCRNNSKRSCKNSGSSKSRLSNRKQDEVVDNLVTSFKEMFVENKDVRKTSSIDATVLQSVNPESSMVSSISKKNSQSSLGTKSKTRFNFSEYSETVSFYTDSEEDVKAAKPVHVGCTERLRTSDKNRSSPLQNTETQQKLYSNNSEIVPNSNDLGESKSESCKLLKQKKKPNRYTRRRILDPQDESNYISLSENKETEIPKLETSTASLGKMEGMKNSQFNNSDIVPTSDVEEKLKIEECKNGNLHKYKLRTSSRILKSRSQINGMTSMNMHHIENSDCASMSDPKISQKTATDENSRQKPKSKASTRVKKSSKPTDTSAVALDTSDSQNNREKINKPSTSNRSKHRR